MFESVGIIDRIEDSIFYEDEEQFLSSYDNNGWDEGECF